METAATLDMHPMWVNLEPAMPILEGYEQAEDDRKVYACIASYANSQGIAWPTYRNIMHKTGLALQRVKRSAWRLAFKNLLAIPRKEKKNNDIHPRNIYQINKALLRKEPDTRSSHFDAEKWKPFAARLKKFVSDAVDTVKQVAAGLAENMARKPKKQRKQRQNRNQQGYRWNNWNQRSYEAPVLSPEERQRQDWINRLCQQGEDVLMKADMTPDGFWEAERYIRKRLTKTPEKYDSILQDAIEKFKDFYNLNCWETRVQLGLDPLGMYKSHQSTVQNVRLMSSEDEPKTLGGILGAASA